MEKLRHLFEIVRLALMLVLAICFGCGLAILAGMAAIGILRNFL